MTTLFYCPCAQCMPQRVPEPPTLQNFWRCVHRPSAIENWNHRNSCEHGCHLTTLRWHDNGVHPEPAYA
jgi:hypothetical protein